MKPPRIIRIEDLIGLAIGNAIKAMRAAILENALDEDALDLMEQYLDRVETLGFINMPPPEYQEAVTQTPHVRARINVIRAVLGLKEFPIDGIEKHLVTVAQIRALVDQWEHDQQMLDFLESETDRLHETGLVSKRPRDLYEKGTDICWGEQARAIREVLDLVVTESRDRQEAKDKALSTRVLEMFNDRGGA